MRVTIITSIITVQLLALACDGGYEKVSKADANPEFYLSQSPGTDPGEFAYLYHYLPSDYEKLCTLIKQQFIHPLEVAEYLDVIPEERSFEDTMYLSVNAMLHGLLGYDSSGLAADRKPENRLMVACLHHSLMFASIVRHQRTPVRIRFGFAPYIGRMVGKNVSVSHVVCEVWNEEESRWMYIDPDRQMVDFPPDEFICGSEAWLSYRAGDIDIDRLKSAFFFREQSILDMLRLDLNYALRNEIMYWGESGPPDVPKVEDLTPSELKKLDRIAELLKHAGSHTDELQHLKNSVEFLRE